ncbi:acyl CoA:acetate/3-ketoacid CoA transferase [Halomonas sp. McH1-25]|uniref:CoA-transferase n=1 Tax=unclassified Halomonas TaxID=2609666 RepID=UPI001EF402D5|nr:MULTISPECIES: CoA-transferase [unclassified Halomonas]MCG7601579.1 acyl CoA:acetate/3-ketoacid CoA transferase [Halomonas sp. McH1-25]MCP1343150.1 acyl CoA:acetate/3-ketoacid CoA transferase [Halomonas sp. FL8]MCP1360961.1 acyl CoA:acetate/3-ketoacid CoA transferase [Halomonas sp. BBD45]MCP1364076.1 acyl CoA:acetate/3-ketoacid CoA transferase [Halomonas sp. BBD48]
MEIMTPPQAVSLIKSGATLVPGGFGSCGHPDLLTEALEIRYCETGQPNNLTLLFASGAGDRKKRGLDRLAHSGLIAKAIGGFWNLCPKLRDLGEKGEIEAHNWPQGVISKLFSAIAEGSPGIITKTGLGTFIDPRVEGGSFIPSEYRSLLEVIYLKNENYLFYPSLKVDFALHRGTVADHRGNISLREEASRMDAFSQAQAARNSGGKVLVQVKEVTDKKLEAEDVAIPGHLVDVVVVADSHDHPFTYGYAKCPNDTGNMIYSELPLARKRIIDRALEELPTGPFHKKVINFGIGIPAEVGACMTFKQRNSYTITIESGVIGGTPLFKDAFGASIQPDARIDQSQLFTFYDGGGIDKAFLGFAQIDSLGHVNVSKFNGCRPGAGGFINITMNAKELIFCGTITANGVKKLVEKVEQITFNPVTSKCNRIKIITELAVFEIKRSRLVLTELLSNIGMDELRSYIDSSFTVDPDIKIKPL